jgi:hypothetical protein
MCDSPSSRELLGRSKGLEAAVAQVRHRLIRIQAGGMLDIYAKSLLPELSTTGALPEESVQIISHLHKCPFAHSRFRGFLVPQIGEDRPAPR